MRRRLNYMSPRSKNDSTIGIRGKTLVLFVTVSFVSLALLGYIAVENMKTLGGISVNAAEDMGEMVVDESTTALNNLAEKKLRDVAFDAVQKTDVLLQKVGEDTKTLAAVISPWIARSGWGQQNVTSFIKNMYENIPHYKFIDYDGKMTGATPSLYQQIFVMNLSGHILSVEGMPDIKENVNNWYGDQHYFNIAMEMFVEENSEIFYYDPFLYNKTAGNSYWEPAYNGEDRIVLPHSELHPFSVVLPSNLLQLQKQSYDAQHDNNTMLHPNDGNWNPEQLGLIVLAPIKGSNGNKDIIGIAGITMSLPAVTQFVREIKYVELQQNKEGYAYMFNTDGILISHKDKEHIGSDSSWHKWVAHMLNDDSGFISYEWRDRYRFVAYNLVSIPEWRIAVTSLNTDFIQPALDTKEEIDTATAATEKSITNSTDNSRTQFIGIVVITIVIVILVGLVLANQIVAPIRELTEIANLFGGGDRQAVAVQASKAKIDTKVVQRRDEIGTLAAAINDMVSALKEHNTAALTQSEMLVEGIKDEMQQFMERNKPDVHIEIKDSVIHRSVIGADEPLSSEPKPKKRSKLEEPVFKTCPYCGKALKLPKKPEYCPYCSEWIG